jgi:endonuclease/exonuclease/phosphatase family metal-dependent hydrolase
MNEHPFRWRAVVAGALAVSACARPLNYAGADGPRFAGGTPRGGASPAALRLVTFNIKFGERLDSAIALLRETPELRDADILALQEVDAAATTRIADSLDMAYVYYPATLHPLTDRDFGNAILSRWPITADRKIVLPHRGRLRGTLRVATAATIDVAGTPVRAYSVHLGTVVDLWPRSRADQLEVILADAAAYPYVAVIGDMNNHGVG